jgi:hypothetical protein
VSLADRRIGNVYAGSAAAAGSELRGGNPQGAWTMNIFNFLTGKKTEERKLVLKALRPCTTCNHAAFVHSGFVDWHVACGKCGALYQIEGVFEPIAARVYE